jgi:hypothetical protein
MQSVRGSAMARLKLLDAKALSTGIVIQRYETAK